MFDEAFVRRPPAVKPGQVGFDPGLVEEDEAVRVWDCDLPLLEFLAFRGDVGPLLLGGDQRFFLNEIFKSRNAYQSVEMSQSTPSVIFKASRVRLGSSATAARSSASCVRWNGTR